MGSMVAEAVPYIGIGVIVAVTTLEVRDACDTMKDLHELNVAFNPETATPDGAREVCGTRVPTKEEVWAAAKRKWDGVDWTPWN